MAKTPLTATFKASWFYSVSSFEHRTDMYLKAVSSGDMSGYDTVPRPGFTAVGVSAIADKWWNQIKGIYKPADTAFGRFILSQYVAGAWIPRWTYATAVVATAVLGTVLCHGETVFGYTTDNKKMPLSLYEDVMEGTYKFSSYVSTPAALQPLLNTLYNLAGTAGNDDAYAWRVGRNNQYAGSFLSLVLDSNEKLRRLRHFK